MKSLDDILEWSVIDDEIEKRLGEAQQPTRPAKGVPPVVVKVLGQETHFAPGGNYVAYVDFSTLGTHISRWEVGSTEITDVSLTGVDEFPTASSDGQWGEASRPTISGDGASVAGQRLVQHLPEDRQLALPAHEGHLRRRSNGSRAGSGGGRLRASRHKALANPRRRPAQDFLMERFRLGFRLRVEFARKGRDAHLVLA